MKGWLSVELSGVMRMDFESEREGIKRERSGEKQRRARESINKRPRTNE